MMCPIKQSIFPMVKLVLILFVQLISTKMSSAKESNHTHSLEERITAETFEKLQKADNSTIERLQEIDNSTMPLISKFSIAIMKEEIPECPPGTGLNPDNKCQKVYKLNNNQKDNSNETKSEAIDEYNSSSESEDNDCHAFHSGNPKLMFLLGILHTVAYLILD